MRCKNNGRALKQQRLKMCTPPNQCMYFEKLKCRIVPMGEEKFYMSRKFVKYVFLYKV